MTHIVLTKKSKGFQLFNKRSGKPMGRIMKDYHEAMEKRIKVDRREDRLHPKKDKYLIINPNEDY